MKSLSSCMLLPLAALCAGQAAPLMAQNKAPEPKQAKPAAPNLVFIMADQWRGQALGCLGKEPVHTPHLDRLAAEGIHFTDAVSSYPVSSPARGMLMSGMYPIHNKVIGNCNSNNAPYGVELPTTVRCWSDVLADQGYDLGYLGKWHLDSPYTPYIPTHNNLGKVAWNEWCPPERRHGFRHWIAYGTYDKHLRPMYWNAQGGRDDYYYVDQWGPEFEADRAIDFIVNKGDTLRDASKPFALVVSMNPPHTGYDLVPDKYKALYRDVDVETLCGSPAVGPKGTQYGDFYRENLLDYYACMSGVDEQVGRIVACLKAQGLFENTLVVFTSDHGDMMGMHNVIGKNCYYEGAMHIPLILSWPARLAPRRDSTLSVGFADLYPTLLSLMGLREAIPSEVESFDLADRLLYPLAGEEASELVQPYYFINPGDLSTGWRGLRTRQYTFAVHATEGKPDEWVLFDRKADPHQMQNLAAMQPARVADFSRQLYAWLQKTGDPFAAFLEASVAGSRAAAAGEGTFVYEKGKSFVDVPAESMSAPLPLKDLPTAVFMNAKVPQGQTTLSYEVELPAYVKGIFFSRDLRPGDYQWPNNTNRLLPWTFTRLEELRQASYPGIPSNGKPLPLGDALLLELEDGQYLFAKAVAGGNSLSWLRVNEDGSLQVFVSTLGTDALAPQVPLLLSQKGATAYEAIQKAYDVLMKDAGLSALQKRTDKAYFEAFEYLGWCSWEHYHYDIDEAKMLHDLDLIEASGLPIRYVLIDDGHLRDKDKRLNSFLPHAQRFPQGWERIMARKREDKVKWMGLWYNFCGYWMGIAPENDFPAEVKASLYPYRETLLPGRDAARIATFYRYYVNTLKDYGFDFLKIDNQSFLLPLYMGGTEVVRQAKACNVALEEATHQAGMGLINCMAQNVLNIDHTKYSEVTRVSIDYKKYNRDMAKSHLFQSYTNTLLQGQSVWPDHDMFHSCDTICGDLMARSKALSGGPVYLSDAPADFVPEYIWPLVDAQGKIFRPGAPAIPTPESVITNPLQDGKAYRVFAPTGDEALSLICYNLNTAPEHGRVCARVGSADYRLRETLTGASLPQGERFVLYDWAAQSARELTGEVEVELQGFTDRLFHLCPVVQGWAVIGLQEKYLSPATVRIVDRTDRRLTLEVLSPGTLRVWVENGRGKELRSISLAAPGRIRLRK